MIEYLHQRFRLPIGSTKIKKILYPLGIFIFTMLCTPYEAFACHDIPVIVNSSSLTTLDCATCTQVAEVSYSIDIAGDNAGICSIRMEIQEDGVVVASDPQTFDSGALAGTTLGLFTFSYTFNNPATASSITLVHIDADDGDVIATFPIGTLEPIETAITCPNDLVLECGEYSEADVQAWLNGATATGTCDVDITNDYVAGSLGNPCAGNTAPFELVVTFVATDDCDNTDECTATIRVEDNNAPTIECPANGDLTLECGEFSEADVTAWLSSVTATDVCDANVAITNDYVPGSLGIPCADGSSPFEMVVTFTATDDCGNTDQCTATISVEDNTPPMILCASHMPLNIRECEADINPPTLLWTDNCAQGGDLLPSDPVINGDPDCNGTTYTYTYTVSDDCGNTAEPCVIVYELSNLGPTISCPADETVECAEDIVVGMPTTMTSCELGATTSVDGPYICDEDDIDFLIDTGNGELASTDELSRYLDRLSVQRDGANPNCPGTVHLYIHTVTDDCERTASCPQMFTIDNADPIIHCPDDLIIECDYLSDYADIIDPWLASVTGTTPCELGYDIVNDYDFNNFSDDCGATGSQVVTFTMTDECGRIAICDRTIEIVDTHGPVVTMEAEDITIDCGDDIPDAEERTYAVDECSAHDISIHIYDNPVTGSGCPDDPYVVYREFEFTDDCGNKSYATQGIYFDPGDGPTIECQTDVAIAVECPDDIEHNPIVTTSCDLGYDLHVEGPEIIEVGGPNCNLTCYHYDYTATDECGRSASCHQVFVIINDGPQFVSCPIDTLYKECGDPFIDHDQVIDDWLNAVEAYNSCGAAVTITNTYSEDGFEPMCGYGGIQTVTFTATNECGESTTCTGVIYSQDTKPPIIHTEAQDLTVECSDAEEAFNDWIADNGGALIVDCCGEVTYVTDPADPMPSFCEGSMDITFIASDECGLSVSTTATFTVIPTPTVISQEAISIAIHCGDGFDVWLAANGGAEYAEGCGDVTWSTDPANPTAPDVCGETVEVTFTATDRCGYAASTTATYESLPVGPSITAEAENDSGECGAGFDEWLANRAGAAVEAGCTDYTWSMTPANPEAPTCGGSTVVTWTATDECGLSVSTAAAFTDIHIGPSISNEASDGSGECGEGFEEWFDSFAGAGAVAGCTDFTWSYPENPTPPSTCGDNDSVTITWTATDECGVSVSTSATFTSINVGPTLTKDAYDISNECGYGFDYWIHENGGAEAEAGCTALTWTTDPANPALSSPCEDYTVTFIATDECGESVSSTATFTAVDDTAPVFTSVPKDLTLYCADGIDIPYPTATDNCSDVTITYTEYYNETATPENCNDGYGYDIFRTWTATDACGNTATATTEAWALPAGYSRPTFNFVPANRTVGCDDTAEFGTATCDSPCGDVILSYEDAITVGNDCSEATIMIRTWTGIDDCGNAATASQTLTIPPDTEAPVFTFVPENRTISCGEAPNFGTPTCRDNCSTIDHLAVTYNDVEIPNSCAIERTWTVTDNCGNVATASQRVSVEDNDAPTVTNTITDKVLTCGQAMEFDTPEFADACSAIDVLFEDEEITQNAALCALGTAQKRTWTATDACGNITTIAQTIAIEDNEAPVFTFVPENQILNCGETAGSAEAEVMDDCSAVDVKVTDSEATGTCATGYTFVRTWTATDVCGNVAEATQSFTTGADNTAPEFDIAVQDKVLTCGESTDFDNPKAIDACSAVDVIVTNEDLSTSCENSFSKKRTWTATDACGNVTSISQTISMEDNTAPIFANVVEDKVLTCGAAFDFDTPTAFDACSEVSLEFYDEDIASDCTSSVSKTRTWTATDACGNVATIDQTIAIEDNTAPEFTFVPESQTLSCGESVDFGQAEVTDACSEVDVNYKDSEVTGECAIGYTFVRTWTATDACGNVAEASQTFTTGADNAAPEFDIAVQDKVLTCGESTDFDNPKAIDACSAVDVIVTDEDLATSCANSFSKKRTWTATDACGNATSISQTISMEDNDAPTFDATPQDRMLTCGEAAIFDTPTATDVCSNATITYEDEQLAQTCGNNFSVKRTWTATDACGNMTTIAQTLSAEDTTAPAFTFVPQSETLTCGQTPTFGEAQVTDVCSAVELTFVDEINATECDNTGATYKRTWTATDACGNAVEAIQVITMEVDNDAPTFTFVPESQTLNCGQTPVFGEVEVADNCSAVDVTFVDSSVTGECAVGYTFVRTWTATDACGNAAQVSQSFATNADNTAPVIEGVEAGRTLQCGEFPNFSQPAAVDACGAVEITSVDEITEGECAIATYTRIWTATDDCGNVSTASQEFVYEADTDAPTFTTQLENREITCGALVEFDIALAVDNCNGAIDLTFMDTQVTQECETFYSRTWTAVDNCGNVSNAVQIVKMTDNIAPEFTYVPEDKVLTCSDANGNNSEPEVADNCGNISIDMEETEVVDACGVITTRTWTATDACGNVATATQTVTLEDTEAPVVEGDFSEIRMSCINEDEFTIPTVSDDCSLVEMTYVDVLEGGTCSGGIERMWTISDACGNAVVVSQKAFIADEEAPIFRAVVPDMVMSESEFNNWIPPTLQAFDNCMSATVTGPFADFTPETCEGHTIHLYTWIATDACGNATEHTTIIEVIDAGNTLNAGINFDQRMLCSRELRDINANIIGGVAPYTIDWDLESDDNDFWAVSGTRSNKVLSLNTGRGKAYVTLTVTDAIGCQITRTAELYCDLLGEGNTIEEETLKVDPNPVYNRAWVQFYSPKAQNTTIKVVDMLGRELGEVAIEAFEGENTHRVDMQDYAPGTYVIYVRIGNRNISQKIVKVDF